MADFKVERSKRHTAKIPVMKLFDASAHRSEFYQPIIGIVEIMQSVFYLSVNRLICICI